MKTKHIPSRISFSLILFFFILLFSPTSSLSAIDFQGENEYCILPPFVEAAATPNLLLMFDNSASMFDLGYVAGTFSPPATFACNGIPNPVSESFCFDDSYINSKVCSENPAQTCVATTAACTCIDQYMGYFDQTKIYRYVEAPVDNLGVQGPNDYFQEIAGLPMACTFSTDYVCVNFIGTGTSVDPYKVSGFAARGKFLNWLAASKLDIQKYILTGGKYDGAYLIGESRGCVGRRFVKLIKNPATGAYYPITFATRGPNALEPDFVNPATQGGLTRVEIYKAVNANIKDCQCAVANWTDPSGNPGQARTQTGNCLSVGSAEVNMYNQIIGDCLQIKKNIEAAQPPYGATGNTPSYNSTQVQCENVYKDLCGNKAGVTCSKTGLNPTTAAGRTAIFNGILNDNAGNWACTETANHLNPPLTSPYASFDTPDPILGLGFLGKCVTFTGFSGAQLSVTWDNTCTQREILHYCYGQSVAEVTDPSEGAADTSTTGNVPSALMDSSVRSLGTPAGTLFARVQAAAPSGVIQDFSNRIRFGVSRFNQVGTQSECNQPNTNIKCPTAGVNRDGSYIAPTTKVGDPLGGHITGGIIQAIDGIVAETWTPFAEAMYEAIGYFAQRPDLRLDVNDFPIGTDPVITPCQSNNILLISDGLPTADIMRNQVRDLVTYATTNLTYPAGGALDLEADFAVNNACMKFAGSRNVDDLAYLAQSRNIKNFTQQPTLKSQKINTYTIFNGVSQGADTSECNPRVLLENTAIRGGGIFKQAKNPEELNQAIRNMLEAIAGRAASGTAASVIASGEGSGANLLQAIFYPKKEFPGYCSGNQTLACTTSDTCSAAGAGTCITELTWIGTLHNLWYYIDPTLGNNHILIESSPAPPAVPPGLWSWVDETLTVGSDCKVSFGFNTTTNTTEVLPVSGSSCPGSNISLDQAQYFLWEAGRRLYGPSCYWTYDAVTDTWTNVCDPIPPGMDQLWRNIYTTLKDQNVWWFSDWLATNGATKDTIRKLLRAENETDARKIINYVSGGSDEGYRNRMINLVPNPGIPKVARWRFGDIVNSTPRVSSWVQLNYYDRDYHDLTYRDFIGSWAYLSRGKNPGTNGRVYVGANDGMLHAFTLGNIKIVNDQTNNKAVLSGWGLGREEWAFMPSSSLPYMKYLMDPNYSHLFFVDSTPYLFDASICSPWDGACNSLNYYDQTKTVNSWRTVLIGGSRYGGASKDSCSNDINADGALNQSDCVLTPGHCSVTTATFCVTDAECGGGETCVKESGGRSSYFALDVTDGWPNLLWEFSHPELGFATTGPVIVKINARKPSAANPAVSESDTDKNGRWFAIFASGPTGPIDTANHQFQAFSDQNLKLFIFDLKQGPGPNNANVLVIDTGKQFAFSGSLNNSSIDYDMDYQDDAIYVGYAQAETIPPTAATRWTNGGVLRLITREDLNTGGPANSALNPQNWQLSEVKLGGDYARPGIGSVTSSVGHIAHFRRGSIKPDKGWIYFGTGRYYYKTLFGMDDPSTQRTIYGVEETCLTNLLSPYMLADNVCGTLAAPLPDVPLLDATNVSLDTLPSGKNGWFIDLNPASATVHNERIISNPLVSPTGAVFFTSVAPFKDVCATGGQTHLWAVKFDTGGSVASALKGSALMQVSTGEIVEAALSDIFAPGPDNPFPSSDPDFRKGRQSGAVGSGGGIPSLDTALNVFVLPKPIDKFMHIRKK